MSDVAHGTHDPADRGGVRGDADVRFTRFATDIGLCGLAWRASARHRAEDGASKLDAYPIVGFWLPRDDGSLPVETVQRRWSRALPWQGPLPAALTVGVGQIVDLLGGAAKPSLDGFALDLGHVSAFDAKVYAITRGILPGHTRSYGEIATELGDATLARAVGQSLGRNPFAVIVPCHRVLAAKGKSGGFSAPGGVIAKHRLLQIEGALPPSLFD